MNIFYLDNDPAKAAQYHCDKHVVKLILESVQILSTVAARYGVEAPYKPTHCNHPCTLWAGESYYHTAWLSELVYNLNKEYKYRYKPVDHQSYSKWVNSLALVQLYKRMPSEPFTPPPQCMPDEFKCDDTVQAYRSYYRGGKAHLLTYKRREAPSWL